MKENLPLKNFTKKIIWEYKFYILAIFFLSVIGSFFKISFDYKIKQIIDEILKKPHISIHKSIFTALSLVLGWHFMYFIRRIFKTIYEPKMSRSLTSYMYQKIIHQPLSWFDSKMSGELTNKIDNFSESFCKLISKSSKSLSLFWNIFISLFFIAKINSLILITTVAFVILYSVSMFYLLKRQLRLENKFSRSSQMTNGVINDSLKNIYNVKIIGNEETEYRRSIRPTLNLKRKNHKKILIFETLFIDMADTILVSSFLVIQLFNLIYQHRFGRISIGDFTFVSLIIFKIQNDIGDLLDYIFSDINPRVASIMSSYRIFEKQDIDIRKIEKNEYIKIDTIDKSIELRDLTFSYNGKVDVLKNINLTIKSGEKIGIAGYSGSGKSTLIKLLIKYFSATSGDIYIDGKKISDIDVYSLIENISIIPQNSFLFNRTIWENLIFVKPLATEEEVVEACKKAHIHNDIIAMPNGYNTKVGENGSQISLGQGQRISIARAILKNCPVLILDEATSSLDYKTEMDIQNILDELIKTESKTVIAIAHRLSTLKDMDRIIVVDKGEIIEEGSHDALIAKEDSFYNKLWELQKI